MYGRRMKGGGTPPPLHAETLMPNYRTGYRDWITGVDEYEVDQVLNPGEEFPVYNVSGLGCLMASGFNPLTFELHQTHDVYPLPGGGFAGPTINSVTFWCHDALMMVPTTGGFAQTDSEKLTRFKFWVRSQSHIKLRNIEPSVPAPVYVFYHGEDLEIVYREAERFNTDLAGAFQAGDFWATSLDLRGKVTSHPRFVDDRSSTTPYINSMQTLFKIGLIIPSGVREGYAFIQSMFGPLDPNALNYGPARAVWNPHKDINSIKWYLFLPGMDIAEETTPRLDTRECALQYHQPRLETDAPDITYTLSGNTYNYSEIGVMPWMWWWQWTHEIFDLGSLGYAYQHQPQHLSKSKGISWGVSASTAHDFYYTTDGPELGFNPWDMPWWYTWGVATPGGGFAIDQLPPPAPIFVYKLPEKIVITYKRNPAYNEYVMTRPTDITFVGGV